MHLASAIPRIDPGDIRGNSAGFADFYCQFWPGTGALDRFCTLEARYTGKTHGIFNIATILIQTAWTGYTALYSKHT